MFTSGYAVGCDGLASHTNYIVLTSSFSRQVSCTAKRDFKMYLMCILQECYLHNISNASGIMDHSNFFTYQLFPPP